MKAKHFLMIAILSLMRMAEARHVSDPRLAKSAKQRAAMANLIEVVEPRYPANVKISGK
jgi:hypothetical protein